ncbi:MAG TPA: hypothetical protein VGH19_05015 [Verrucomicrobiae bacterium]
MNTSRTIAWLRSPKVSPILIWTALAITLLALCRIGYVLRLFYLDTAALAPGTAIRPLGVTYHLAIAWFASLLCGGACAFTGGIFATIQRRWNYLAFALLATGLTLAPLLLSNWGFNHIVQLRQLLLKD